MKNFMALFLFLSLFSVNVYAGLGVDPFAQPPSISQQQIIDSIVFAASRPGDSVIYTEKRTIRVLSQTEAKQFGLSSSYLESALGSGDFNSYSILANFIHGLDGEKQSRFWLAVLPKSVEVQNLILQVEWFVQGAGAHLQLRHVLKQPMLLIPQAHLGSETPLAAPVDARTMNADASLDLRVPHIRKGDFIYTLLALRTVNGPQDWDPVTGLTGAFANAFSFQSTEHAAVTTINQNFVQQLEINLNSAQQGNLILEQLIRASDARGETEIYNTVYNSCVTAVMQALAADGKGLSVDARIYNPYLVVQTLQDKGLLKQVEMPSLNEEFNGAIREADINQALKAKVDQLMPLILSPLFDGLVRTIAVEIAQNRWTPEEVLSLFKVFQVLPKGASPDQAVAAIRAAVGEGRIVLPDQEKVQSLVRRLVQTIQQNVGDFDPQILQLISSFRTQNQGR